MAPQDSQNCGRDFAKRKQTDADFAANSLLRMVIIDIESNNSVGGLTLDPAGMHCPSWDDAFVSSVCLFVTLRERRPCVGGVHSSNKLCAAVYCPISTRISAFFSEGIALSGALQSSHFRR